MSTPTSALVVKPEWAELLISGTKRWELRGSNTLKRGRVALAVSGTQELIGDIKIVDSVKVMADGKSLLPLPLEKFEPLHRVSDLSIIGYKSVFAWIMEDPIRYSSPKPFEYNQGAVVWVSLNKDPNGSAKRRKCSLNSQDQ